MNRKWTISYDDSVSLAIIMFHRVAAKFMPKHNIFRCFHPILILGQVSHFNIFSISVILLIFAFFFPNTPITRPTEPVCPIASRSASQEFDADVCLRNTTATRTFRSSPLRIVDNCLLSLGSPPVSNTHSDCQFLRSYLGVGCFIQTFYLHLSPLPGDEIIAR